MVGEDQCIFLHCFTDSLANIHWTHIMFHTLCILLWVQRWIEQVIKMTLKIQCFKCSRGVSTRYLGILGLPLTLPWEWGVTALQLVCLIHNDKDIFPCFYLPIPMQPRTRSAQNVQVNQRHLTHSFKNESVQPQYAKCCVRSKAIAMVESYRQLPSLSLHLLKNYT